MGNNVTTLARNDPFERFHRMVTVIENHRFGWLFNSACYEIIIFALAGTARLGNVPICSTPSNQIPIVRNTHTQVLSHTPFAVHEAHE